MSYWSFFYDLAEPLNCEENGGPCGDGSAGIKSAVIEAIDRNHRSDDRGRVGIHMLYHGTYIKGLERIKANSRSHASGGLVAYFTEDRCYALICCRRRQENFVTMGLRDDGKQHYFERFPDQLECLYGGKKGYLYLAGKSGLINTKGHTWESAHDVMVTMCEEIDDVYSEILKEEERRNIVIHRYDQIDPAEQKVHANYIKEHLDDDIGMKPFYLEHFSSLWDG